MTVTKKPNPTWRLVQQHLDLGRLVVGIDEVGRGAWAGPVVSAAVLLPPKLRITGLRDSKLLSPAKREELARTIKRQALAIGIGWVEPRLVDEQGLTWAVRQAGLEALNELNLADPVIILDGKYNFLSATHTAEVFVKADAKIVPVAAASIIAKVARDRYMTKLALRAPHYGFEHNKGYGTSAHRLALQAHGPTQLHRRSWAPFYDGDQDLR
jgi:ribonuclease HII